MPAPDPRLIVRNPAPLNPEAKVFPYRVEPPPFDVIFGLARLDPGAPYRPPSPENPARFAE